MGASNLVSQLGGGASECKYVYIFIIPLPFRFRVQDTLAPPFSPFLSDKTAQFSFLLLYNFVHIGDSPFQPHNFVHRLGTAIFSVGRRTQAATRRRPFPPMDPGSPRRSPSDFQTFGDRPAIQEAFTQDHSDTAQFLQSELRWHSGAHTRGSHTEQKR